MEENSSIYIPLVKNRIVKEKDLIYGKEGVCSSERAVRLAKQIVEGADREVVIAISVDAKCKPVAIEVISIGTLTESKVAGREIYKHAIVNSAAGIIIMHNHPSGNPIPSEADYQMTNKLKMAAELLDIQFLDHIIMGDEGRYYSMNEKQEKIVA